MWRWLWSEQPLDELSVFQEWLMNTVIVQVEWNHVLDRHHCNNIWTAITTHSHAAWVRIFVKQGSVPLSPLVTTSALWSGGLKRAAARLQPVANGTRSGQWEITVVSGHSGAACRVTQWHWSDCQSDRQSDHLGVWLLRRSDLRICQRRSCCDLSAFWDAEN